MSVDRSLPMFPLSVVLLPGGALPLHIFEERYRRLMHDLLAGESEMLFGIPPILRGSEVGGGDERAEVATLVVAADPRVTPDGRFALLAVAVGRVEVLEWLPDAPYPSARVVDMVDTPGSGADVIVEPIRDRALDLARRSGVDLDGSVTLPSEPGEALFALATIAPIADLDRLALLMTRRVDERAALLLGALDDLEAVLKFRES
ncbi:MAG: LON peptidase substrate-binding domain-containing protein [Actinomycetota bacterium]|nr:LON peptidase substrate-binding domain-containing protein [Actinomycetota bacterium]MDA3014155.1 LON peptidase substrate-binding domain-containing protein [Actinomycetota bacterium]MDA3028360.1 LON peptidase substrate-binding domain-containing protein [Actinomycetota bacterium]